MFAAKNILIRMTDRTAAVCYKILVVCVTNDKEKDVYLFCDHDSIPVTCDSFQRLLHNPAAGIIVYQKKISPHTQS